VNALACIDGAWWERGEEWGKGKGRRCAADMGRMEGAR
jgi:hypothetical protein